MKHLELLISILIFLILAASCAPPADLPESTDAPAQTATGGVAAPADNINVKDIDIELGGDETVITISMLSGSRAAGYTESKLVSLPKYEITQLPQPQRLMIRLENISFWDYTQKDSWALSDFVIGLFREVPAKDDSLILYVQMSQSADFSVEEVDGDLVIRLKPAAVNTSSMYYCAANAFFEHQEGSWPESLEMLPVLCSDITNKLLISSPFETEQEAQAFSDSANEVLSEALPEIATYVVELTADALPNYANHLDGDGADNVSLVMKQGVLMGTPVLLQNGKYLATAPDGRIAFSRSYKPEEPSLEQDSYLSSEKLWILDPNGRVQTVDVPEFFSISRAEFSADGRYIAILDLSIENRVLYIYDFEADDTDETGQSGFINLGEEGFGDQTAAFAWSDTDEVIYAMTGYSAMQMMACEMLPSGDVRIFAVEEMAGSEGTLAVSQGRLFFADSFAGESGVIYEIGDTRREITTGIDFKISPDGTQMLVLETRVVEEEERIASLKLCDIETGETTEIVEGAEIVDFSFMQGGGKVYYTDAAVSEPMGEYIYGLFSYDIISGTLEQVALMATDSFAKGQQPGEVYLINYVEDEAQDYYATYTYDSSI